MNSAISEHPWSEDSLLCKARLYIDQMEEHQPDDWQYGLWSALALELLARSALAHISPALLADNRKWENIAYSLGLDESEEFLPRSISSTELFSRLQKFVVSFNKEISGFCQLHMNHRNHELHSGNLEFAQLGTSEWLPKFYRACKVLLEFMGRSLEDLIAETERANELIQALSDGTASSVKKDVAAHTRVWNTKDESFKKQAVEHAKTWATRQKGHRVRCPACNSQALLKGSPSGPCRTKLVDDEVKQQQSMIPSSFECSACGLRISGYSRLSAVGLGDAFTATHFYSVAEFFDLYTEDDLEEARNAFPEYEPDFND